MHLSWRTSLSFQELIADAIFDETIAGDLFFPWTYQRLQTISSSIFCEIVEQLIAGSLVHGHVVETITIRDSIRNKENRESNLNNIMAMVLSITRFPEFNNRLIHEPIINETSVRNVVVNFAGMSFLFLECCCQPKFTNYHSLSLRIYPVKIS
jgi:hypothetical protein